MTDLPTIVEAIRKQMPGVVPEWLATYQSPSCTTDVWLMDKDTGQECREEAVSAMLVGWLSMAYATADAQSRVGLWGRNKDGQWFAFALDSDRETTFPPTTIGCILALCHALGIRLEDKTNE